MLTLIIEIFASFVAIVAFALTVFLRVKTTQHRIEKKKMRILIVEVGREKILYTDCRYVVKHQPLDNSTFKEKVKQHGLVSDPVQISNHYSSRELCSF